MQRKAASDSCIFDNILTEGLICNDDDIGILAAFCQLILILLLCVIRHNSTSCFHCCGCFASFSGVIPKGSIITIFIGTSLLIGCVFL